MTGAQFARFVAVRYSTLMYWLQKRRKQTGQSRCVSRCASHKGIVGFARGMVRLLEFGCDISEFAKAFFCGGV